MQKGTFDAEQKRVQLQSSLVGNASKVWFQVSQNSQDLVM